MQFEFDPRKSAGNKTKHGLDFVEAQRLWSDANRVRVPAHIVDGETRYAVLGTIRGKPHTVIVTYRDAVVRIISARLSSKPEARIYEEQKKKS